MKVIKIKCNYLFFCIAYKYLTIIISKERKDFKGVVYKNGRFVKE